MSITWTPSDIENGIVGRDHSYGEFSDGISTEEYIEQILSKCKEEHLINGLTETIIEKYHTVLNGRRGSDRLRKNARMKVKSLVKGNYDKWDFLSGLNSREKLFELIFEAVEEGNIYEFKIELPWHPKIFFDRDELTTYPYQHKYIISYSGKPKHIFFTKEGKKFALNRGKNKGSIPISELNNQKSVLKQGYLKGGSPHKINGSSEGEDEAIWTSFLKQAHKYPMGAHGAGKKNDDGEIVYSSNITLEVCAPSNFLILHITSKRWENVNQLNNDFGSPKELRDSWRNSGQDYDFKVARKESQEKGGVALPLRYITGVWDREHFSNSPYFMKLEKYINYLYDEFPDRMPEPNSNLNITFEPDPENHFLERQKNLEKEISNIRNDIIEVLKKDKTLYKRLVKYVPKIKHLIKDYRSKGESNTTLKQFYVFKAINYINSIEGLRYKEEGFLKNKIEEIESHHEANFNKKEMNLASAIEAEMKNEKASSWLEETENLAEAIRNKERKAYEQIEKGKFLQGEETQKAILDKFSSKYNNLPFIVIPYEDRRLLRKFICKEFNIREDVLQVDDNQNIKFSQDIDPIPQEKFDEINKRFKQGKL